MLRCRNCTATLAFLQCGSRLHQKLRCSKRKTALQHRKAALQESGAFLPLSCGFQAPTFRHPRLGPAELSLRSLARSFLCHSSAAVNFRRPETAAPEELQDVQTKEGFWRKWREDSERSLLADRKVPQRNCVTGGFSRAFRWTFCCVLHPSPCFTGSWPRNPLELFRKFFGAVRAIFGFVSPFCLPIYDCSYRVRATKRYEFDKLPDKHAAHGALTRWPRWALLGQRVSRR